MNPIKFHQNVTTQISLIILSLWEKKNRHCKTAKNVIRSDTGWNERMGQEDCNQQAVIIVAHNYYFYCKCDFVSIMMITTKTFILNRRQNSEREEQTQIGSRNNVLDMLLKSRKIVCCETNTIS
jgi:hypothetical protein